MEERLERNWKRVLSLRGNITDTDLASFVVFLLSFNYKHPVVFSEMKNSLAREVDVNSFLKNVISQFCREDKIDESLERNIGNLVQEHGFVLRQIIIDWEFLELSEKEYDIAFDYIFEKINTTAGKFGAFSTSGSLRKLIQELTPKDLYSALDPACGSGSLLGDFLSNGGQRAFGQDINAGPLNFARLRFLDHPSVNLSLGDSLTSELFNGKKSDVVLCNPPYNLRIDREQLYQINESFGEGLIRSSSINLAWVMLGLHYLKEEGTGIFVLPVSSLSNSVDYDVRKRLVESGQVQAIICLPGNMLLYSSVLVCIWVVKKVSSTTHRDVLLIDAASQVSAQARNLTTIDTSVISNIGMLVESFRQGEVLTKSPDFDFVVASQIEIENQEYFLQPSRFLDWKEIDGPSFMQYVELGSVLSRPSFIPADVPQVGVKKISVQNLNGSLSKAFINYEELTGGGKRPIFINSDQPILLIARIGKRLKPTILSNYQALVFDFVNVFYYEVDTSKAIIEYLIIELEKPYVLSQIDRFQSGATIPSMRRKDLESLKINLPSLEDQKNAVDEEKQMLVRVAEKELQSLTEKIGLEKADANSFLRHKIAGPLKNLRGAFSNINLMLEEHVISQFPELLDKKINDKRTKTFKDYLEIFERDLEKVTKLINQSSDEYAIENKTLEEVELISFIENYVGEKEGTEKGVSFKTFIDRDVLGEADAVDIVILSNGELLSDLLDNLIRNAVMHGFKGFVGKKEIHFTILPILVENILKVHLNVSNSGYPVGSSFTIELFSKQGAKTGNSEGNGFGLWYVKEIMKKHNGELKFTDESRLESDIENSMVTTFELIFPIKDLKKNYGEI
uniref:N-6 DNA methylase n=1 Tax=Algoriphagus sp. TaxID=1872435 RepID=UPI0026097C08|nr:N-6 DNA methylase [Algoriphagus sp.]MDG1276918.1 N-6 DNA methylase [Algoriphagus sp.]